MEGENTVGTYNATNTGTGDIDLSNTASSLSVNNIDQSGSGAVNINNTGNIAVTGTVAGNNVTLNSTGSIQETTGTGIQ